LSRKNTSRIHQKTSYIQKMPRNQKKLPTEQQATTYCRPTTPTILKESQTISYQWTTKILPSAPTTNASMSHTKRERMRRHYRLRHSNDIIIIQQEGLLPQCINCGLFQQKVNTEQHKQTKKIQQSTETKRKRQ
jgi:hypothetical protein